MKRIGVLLFMVILVGCANGPKPVATSQPPTPAYDFALGGIALGDMEAAVIKALGDPDAKSVMHGIGIPLWVYKTRDLQIGFRVPAGTVAYIGAGQGFTGSTARGIRSGDPEKALLAAYGELSINRLNGSASAQLSRGDDTIEFSLTDGKVSRVREEHRGCGIGPSGSQTCRMAQPRSGRQ